MSKTPASSKEPDNLFGEIKDLIQSAKQRAAVAVNAELTLLYWQVGQRIHTEVLKGERADYGKQIITDLAKKLTAAFGRGWSNKQLHHCLRFAETLPDPEIVSAVRRQLSWTHIKALIYIEDDLKREFYYLMAAQEGWSTRTLQNRMGSLMYERTMLSRKPETTIEHDLNQLREKDRINESFVLKEPTCSTSST